MEEEIVNRVAKSDLINLRLDDFRPQGKRIGIDFKDFLFDEIILKEEYFKEKLRELDVQAYKDTFVYIYCSSGAVFPLWSVLLLTAKLKDVVLDIVYGNLEELENVLIQKTIDQYNFETLVDKKVLINGCNKNQIPEQAYVYLLNKLLPICRSVMFGEACSNVPLYKR